MPSLRRTSLLLAAALCALAGDLAAQPTQTLSPRTQSRLQDSGVTLRVDRTGVDTMSARLQRVRPGELIVNVTGARPSRIRPSVRIPLPTTEIVQGTQSGTDATPDQGTSTGSTDGGDRPADDGTRPATDEGAARDETPDDGPDPATAPDDDGRIAYELSNYEIGVAGADGARFHVLVPIVEIEGGGLRYNPAKNAYEGSILIGLLDNENPAATDSLGRPVVVQITGDVQSLDAVELWTMNIPFQRVRLSVARPRGDSVLIRLRPTFDPRGGSVISIPIVRATLTLQASPRRIAGFGLEVAELIVMNQDNGDTIPVALTSLLAKPTPSQVRATREGGVSKIRSSGVGVDTVRLAGGAYQGFAVVHYAWPIAFMLAALIGGLFGGVLNALSTKRDSDPRTIAFLGMQGALTGIVGAVLYAVGINVIGWAPSAEYGEALMFAVAFGSGLMGPRIFDKVLPKLSVGLKDGDDAPPPSTPPTPPPAAPSTPEPAAVG